MVKPKVIIIGGGPAGTMTALALTHLRPELAPDVLLLDARSFPREKVCGGGISGRVVTFLDEMGVALQGLARVPVKGFEIFFAQERFHVPFANDKCFVIRRSTFDDYLLQAVRERGVEVRAPPGGGGSLSRTRPHGGAGWKRRGASLPDTSRCGWRKRTQQIVVWKASSFS